MTSGRTEEIYLSNPLLLSLKRGFTRGGIPELKTFPEILY